ncbi:FtsW/RodA/SpoVE family cell cycle protein [Candidatus Pseudoscillospira sp. SGI.172]|uniref:FtsW/RodA/SpoVE family cell cycle protein n=1 Tax=Candidatus Pseudoscillospira sp. SGI.172 TaxID=3420582 RepID=UPI002A7D365B|nr:putative lipid II flippase FtsW [Pseudoflavonifractor sp.]MDY3020077.1 putative peptidoglycan glycosyltransferase FtsW [Oscillospiraceae bacterium]
MPKLKRDLTMEEQLARGPMDLPFLMLVVLLTGIGVIMVFSASYATALNEGHAATYYFIRQGIFAAAGLGLLYVTSKINYQSFRWMSVFVLGFALVLLVLVLVPGIHTNRSDGVKRWIRSIGPIPAFQPSEFAKLGVILYFSARMSKRGSEKKKKFNTRTLSGTLLQKADGWGFTELVPYGVILLVIMLLMKLEPHMSGTILILIPAAAILFAGGVRLGWFALGGAAVGGLLALTMTGYQSTRILVWKDPWAYPKDGGYQIIQSLYAIGSGGLFGVGFGQSRQKQLFIPEPENDFIFSIVCEELGLIGAGLILLLFVMLIVRGYWIALHARDRFGSLLAVGVTTLMAAQVFLNISVVTNFLPTTGISLPFFSYGGTALMIQLIEMGIVLAVSRQIPAPKQG